MVLRVDSAPVGILAEGSIRESLSVLCKQTLKEASSFRDQEFPSKYECLRLMLGFYEVLNSSTPSPCFLNPLIN